MNTNHTFLKKTMTNKDHRIHKNTAYININMLYFYVLYNRGPCFIIRTVDSHFSWAITTAFLNQITNLLNKRKSLLSIQNTQQQSKVPLYKGNNTLACPSITITPSWFLTVVCSNALFFGNNSIKLTTAVIVSPI